LNSEVTKVLPADAISFTESVKYEYSKLNNFINYDPIFKLLPSDSSRGRYESSKTKIIPVVSMTSQIVCKMKPTWIDQKFKNF
jgi:hypothetical protein